MLPSVASDASGDFVVAWESYGQDGSNFGIFGRRYDSAGLPQGPQFRVNSFTSGSQSRPSIASDASGNFVVTWSGGGQGDASGVFGRRYDSDGLPLAGEFRVNSYTTSSQHSLRWPPTRPGTSSSPGRAMRRTAAMRGCSAAAGSAITVESPGSNVEVAGSAPAGRGR